MSLKTTVKLDLGSVVHFIFGALAALLREEVLFTAIFLVKQLLDVYGGEDPAEASGDIAEFTAGLIVGLFIARIIFSV